MKPSVRQLECLVAVADARHFGRAAKRCHVTQPALSTQIALAEKGLGLRIFERGRGGVLVTPAGEAVIARARAVLQDLDALIETAHAVREPLSGRLRLGVIPTVAPYLLPRALPAVRERHPRLVLELREDKTNVLLDLLAAGDLDLLLLALPVSGAHLESLRLFDEPFLLVAPAGHRLTRGRSATISEAQLAGEDVLLLAEGHCLRDQALRVCTSAGAHGSGRVQATSLGTLLQMVANGLGVSLIPESAVDVELRGASGLEVRRLRRPAPGRTIGLVWRTNSPRAAEFAQLGELLAAPSRGRRAYTPAA